MMMSRQNLTYTSDNGAHSIGPIANPKSRKLVPKVATSVATPNSLAMSSVAGAKMALLQVAPIVVSP